MKNILLVFSTLFFISGCASLSNNVGDSEEGAEVSVVKAFALIDDEQEVSCGPYVDGLADFGEDFESGPCRGESCTDPNGCICVKCDDDVTGVCYGRNRETEACDALSEAARRWRIDVSQDVLVVNPEN